MPRNGLATDGLPLSRRFDPSLIDPAPEAGLFLLSAVDRESLLRTIQRLAGMAGCLSQESLHDLAGELAAQSPSGLHRAALVVDRPEELVEGLQRLGRWVMEGRRQHRCQGSFLGTALEHPKVGFLFPGQGAAAQAEGGANARTFDFVRELYPLNGTLDQQSAIVTASLGGLRLLKRLGIEAGLSLGHSLGELVALHWGGVFDETSIQQLAAVRASAMAELSVPGAMAGIGVDAEKVQSILIDEKVVIAAYNSPRQTVVSGETEEVARLVRRAQRKGWPATSLPFPHAFHSSLVAGVAPVLTRYLAGCVPGALDRCVISSVTGRALNGQDDVRALLVRQLTSPVRFIEGVQAAQGKGVDLWVEVGPGQILAGLMADLVAAPVVSMDASGRTLRGLLMAVGAAFVCGVPVRTDLLFKRAVSQQLVMA